MSTLEEKDVLSFPARCLRGMLARLGDKREEVKRLFIELSIDPRAVARNRKSARAMASAGLSRGVGRIGVCPNIALIPHTFLVGVLLHELTHVAFGLMGGDECEVDTDAAILVMAPEAHYHYDDCRYHDWMTGRLRVARNLQCVTESFVNLCVGKAADRPNVRERVSIRWKTKKT